MDNSIRIRDLIKNSLLFHYLEEYSTDNRTVAMSMSGHVFSSQYRASLDEITLEFDLIAPPKYINLYTYGQIADTVGRMGLCLSAPRATEMRTCKITMRKSVSCKLICDIKELETEINTFCFAVDCATKYIDKLDQANQLPNVDVSMWEGIDTEFTDIDRLIERHVTAYIDWDHFIDSVSDIDISDEHRESLVLIAIACKEFEDANPHLVIQEVADSLLTLLDELADKPAPNDYEIN